MQRMLLPVSLLWTGLALPGSTAEYQSAKEKIDLITEEKATRGSTVHFSASEINAFAAGEAAAKAPDAIKDLKVELGAGRFTWTGIVNFAKLAESDDMSMTASLFLRMLKGEKPVTIKALWKSSGGKATVEVESVQVEETEMEGATLAFIVEPLLASNIENAKVGEPFDLEHHVERIQLTPNGIDVKLYP